MTLPHPHPAELLTLPTVIVIVPTGLPKSSQGAAFGFDPTVTLPVACVAELASTCVDCKLPLIVMLPVPAVAARDFSLPLKVAAPVADVAASDFSMPPIVMLPLANVAGITCSVPLKVTVPVPGVMPVGFCCSDPMIVMLAVPPVDVLDEMFATAWGACKLPLTATVAVPDAAA